MDLGATSALIYTLKFAKVGLAPVNVFGIAAPEPEELSARASTEDYEKYF